MAKPEAVKLSLIDNSRAYLVEAVKKAVEAHADPRQWQFAILLLVQSLELSLKSKLSQIHPMFIYADIDKPVHTVTIDAAIGRLCNKEIGKVDLSPDEREQIKGAIKIRNQVTHADYELTTPSVIARFYDVYRLIQWFQRRHLDFDINTIVPADCRSTLLKEVEFLKRAIDEAEQRIVDEGVHADLIKFCFNCEGDTLVVDGGPATCYACGSEATFVECPHCGKLMDECEMESLEDLFEYSCEEGGRAQLQDDFGYSDSQACPDCLQEISAAIEDKRQDQWDDDMRDMYYGR